MLANAGPPSLTLAQIIVTTLGQILIFCDVMAEEM